MELKTFIDDHDKEAQSKFAHYESAIQGMQKNVSVLNEKSEQSFGLINSKIKQTV